MRLRTAPWVSLLSVFFACVASGETPERQCAFTGIRRGEKGACVGVERNILGRKYCVHLPAKPKPGLPVVLLLHGYGSSGEGQSNYFDLDSAVERRGFILVKPDGTFDAGGRRYWNAGRHLSTDAPDDMAYLTAVLDDVIGAYGADTARLFVVGHSNGAFMANRLACERSQRIAAIVSLAGAVNPEACRPVQPVSVLTVHGTSDLLIQYGGGNAGFLGTYASAESTLAHWAKVDGCKGARTDGKPLRLTCAGAGTETAVSSYMGCPPGIAVEHWKLDGIGHIPNFALPAWPEAVLDFLWAHPKPPGTKGAP
jgi:polyhydroxybutyrate depolymerase